MSADIDRGDDINRCPIEIVVDLEAVQQQIRDLPKPADARWGTGQVEADWKCYGIQINTLRYRHNYDLRSKLLIARMAEAGLFWCSYHLDEAPIAVVHMLWIAEWISSSGCDQGGDYFGTDEHSICF